MSDINTNMHTTYRGCIQSAHARHSTRSALVGRILANIKNGYNLCRTGGPLHIWQAFSPGRGWYQPQEGKDCSHQQVLSGEEKNIVKKKQYKTIKLTTAGALLKELSWIQTAFRVPSLVACESHPPYCFIYTTLLNALSVTSSLFQGDLDSLKYRTWHQMQDFTL